MIFRGHTILLVLLMLQLSSCSKSAQTDYGELAAKDRQLLSEWTVQEEAERATLLTDLIDINELNGLVKEALGANPSLQQTLLSLKILQAEYKGAWADQLPELSYGTTVEKGEGDVESFRGSLRVSWELDLWKKLADTSKAVAMDEAEQQELLIEARNSLTAQVMKEWLALIAAQHAINIEKKRLEILEQNEGYILQRYRNGIGTLEDLDSARSSTAVSRANLEEYRENLAQVQRTLKTLLGRTGTDSIEVPEGYPTVIIPLADLPEQTLQGRPDLKAAFFAIEAADLRTTVAYKDLLPTISLEAALEDLSDSPESILLSDPVWTILGQLTAPLFQGGALRAAVEVAELETARYYQIYRETLLNAINEVESGLSLERSMGRRQQHIKSSLTSARNSLLRYQENYRAGLVDILDLLTVQEKTFNIAAQLDNLIYERLVNRIVLGLALGLGVTQ